MDGSSVPHFELGSGKAPAKHGRFTLLPISELNPDPRNPRKHNRAQIRAIARSIEAFGFNAPILITKNKQIIAGHGRFEAAKLSGCTGAQARAYMLADNKLTDRSSWDDAALALHLKELSELLRQRPRCDGLRHPPWDRESGGGVHRSSLQRQDRRTRLRQGHDQASRFRDGLGRDDRG